MTQTSLHQSVKTTKPTSLALVSPPHYQDWSATGDEVKLIAGAKVPEVLSPQGRESLDALTHELGRLFQLGIERILAEEIQRAKRPNYSQRLRDYVATVETVEVQVPKFDAEKYFDSKF